MISSFQIFSENLAIFYSKIRPEFFACWAHGREDVKLTSDWGGLSGYSLGPKPEAMTQGRITYPYRRPVLIDGIENH
jgi:hypothetical protein